MKQIHLTPPTGINCSICSWVRKALLMAQFLSASPATSVCNFGDQVLVMSWQWLKIILRIWWVDGIYEFDDMIQISVLSGGNRVNSSERPEFTLGLEGCNPKNVDRFWWLRMAVRAGPRSQTERSAGLTGSSWNFELLSKFCCSMCLPSSNPLDQLLHFSPIQSFNWRTYGSYRVVDRASYRRVKKDWFS